MQEEVTGLILISQWQLHSRFRPIYPSPVAGLLIQCASAATQVDKNSIRETWTQAGVVPGLSSDLDDTSSQPPGTVYPQVTVPVVGYPCWHLAHFTHNKSSWEGVGVVGWGAKMFGWVISHTHRRKKNKLACTVCCAESSPILTSVQSGVRNGKAQHCRGIPATCAFTSILIVADNLLC